MRIAAWSAVLCIACGDPGADADALSDASSDADAATSADADTLATSDQVSDAAETDGTRACSSQREILLSFHGLTSERTFDGTVTSHALGHVSFGTNLGPVTIDYSVGGEALPLATGDVVHVQVQVRGFIFKALGLAIWDASGRFLAIVDDGRASSAWSGTGIPAPFGVATELDGCRATVDVCATRIPMALRFSHADGSSVLAPFGETALLTTSAGARFRVVNAQAERLLPITSCTDQFTQVSWAILAED